MKIAESVKGDRYRRGSAALQIPNRKHQIPNKANEAFQFRLEFGI